MDSFNQSLGEFIENAGWLAPVFFVVLHLIRPFLFLPVIVVCVAGGLLFGFVEGALLSFIGLSLMGIISYLLVERMPKFRAKLTPLKKKLFGERKVSVGQVMLLRVMPFVHFHLLSLFLIESTRSFKEYAYFSILGMVMPAVLYTAFGQAIAEFSWIGSLLFFAVLLIAYIGIEKWHKRHKERMTKEPVS
ncbi:TVP38/TMEM64 family protein [Planomicrobium sp. YIM 101495]|uniref:TVP38/TMEM64 family protein n=1 Tax=Planomicrobium sp. YIM 101495 TaxID=2665160 RepID=UPI0012B75338|nr:VTT domain-containing protein [Planomicrobium sp. YIM 101495]MTD29833.1 TVP38/TMEM64 family protein [Planomicrobium sp. YIM 101495]